jgi:hypothetical protein
MNLKTILAGLFILVGLALILPGAVMWDALQIQAGLGNPGPLNHAAYNMAGGMASIALAWLINKFTKE